MAAMALIVQGMVRMATSMINNHGEEKSGSDVNDDGDLLVHSPVQVSRQGCIIQGAVYCVATQLPGERRRRR
jgi:hypothetical protein